MESKFVAHTCIIASILIVLVASISGQNISSTTDSATISTTATISNVTLSTAATTTEVQPVCFECDPSEPNCKERQEDEKAKTCPGDICWVSNNKTTRSDKIYRGCATRFGSSFLKCDTKDYDCQYTNTGPNKELQLCECCCKGPKCNRDPLLDSMCGQSLATRHQAAIGLLALLTIAHRLF